jgi:hypothetical protein
MGSVPRLGRMTRRAPGALNQDNSALYPNIPAGSRHRQDIAIYIHYAGPPGTTPNTNWPTWDQPTSPTNPWVVPPANVLLMPTGYAGHTVGRTGGPAEGGHMAADPTRDEHLARLQARIAAQDARIARLEQRRRWRPTRLLPLTLAVLLVALVPLGAVAAISFDDLNPGSPHNANIQAIADAGITTGCVPNVSYCPNDLVTREQMASFLARTAGLGSNPPVANAKTAQSATTADSATNAAQLGGQPASFYQPAGQPIANAVHATTAGDATTVGGYAPSALLRVASAGGPPAALSTSAATPSTITSVVLAAPRGGWALILAEVNLSMLGNACPCSVTFRITAPAGSALRQVDFAGSRTVGSNDTVSVGISAPLTFTWLIPIDGGAPTTITLEGYQTKNNPVLSGGVSAGGTLTALYIPFGYDGGTTLQP